MAWSGHLLIEGNRPTMLRRPLWSLLCDLRMFRLWLSGKLKDELAADNYREGGECKEAKLDAILPRLARSRATVEGGD
jgi:2-hydroxy-palmitic acid dioxygenase Mpo1-like